MAPHHSLTNETDGTITELLHAAAEGDRNALEIVAASVYRELERLAEGKLRRQYGAGLPGATLEADALVNETLLKVLSKRTEFANRRHFFGFANRVMTRVLIDYERRKHRSKRGGGALKITLTGLAADGDLAVVETLELLEVLASQNKRKADVVRMRIFWGLENAEIAEILQVSTKTVERDWRFAKAWIRSN